MLERPDNTLRMALNAPTRTIMVCVVPDTPRGKAQYLKMRCAKHHSP